MRICPECRTPLSGEVTLCSCGWSCEVKDNVLVCLSEKDRASESFKLYSRNYDQIASDDLGAEILDLRYVEHQAANVVDLIGERLKGANVADIGSGQGFLARAMLKQGAKKVTAVDIALSYLKTFNDDRIQPVLANAQNLPFVDEFDVIAATDVAEHVINFGDFLYCANSALKIGGSLVIRVPHEESILKYSTYLGCKYEFVHVRSFSEKLLFKELKEAGFQVERSKLDGYWLGTPQPFWMGGPLRRRIYSRFQAHVTKLLASPVDVTRWPSWLAALWMKPQEIVVVASKIRCFPPVLENRG